MKLKILQINAVNGIRSTGRTTIELAEYIESQGHESFIAYSHGDTYHNGYKIGTRIEKKIHSIFNRVIGKQEYFSTFSTKRLINYINKINPDIVHLRNLHASYINVEILFEYLIYKKKKVVITLHDCWFYTGKCTHYTVDNCFKWQQGCGNCPRLKKDIPSWFFDWTPQMLRDKEKWIDQLEDVAIIGVSNWITGQAKLSILSNARIIDRIYNWINLDTFKPSFDTEIKQKYNIQNKFIILGVASVWTKQKGIDYFIELAKKISDDEIIILVGNLNQDQVLPNNIINIKETHNQKELANIYSAADVFINLSYEETFGKTTAEALSCGTPAVVLNSTANPELVGLGCGYIVENLNVSTIRSAINKVKVNGKGKYTQDCLSFSKLNFDKSTNMKQQIEIYQKLMGGLK